MPADYALTHRCPACHGVAELTGMTGTALVYECACGERYAERLSCRVMAADVRLAALKSTGEEERHA